MENTSQGTVENTTYDLELFEERTSFPNGTNNTSPPPPSRNEFLAKFEIATLSIILYFAIFGNLFVLVVLRLRRQKLTRMQCFIVHLSLADIFVGAFNVLPQLMWDITYRFYGNDFLCRFVKYFQLVAMYASSYVLVMTAIDRYVSICHPLTSQTLAPKRVHLMALLAWGLALLFSIPQIIIFSRVEVKTGVFDCWATFDPPWTDYLNTMWSFFSVFALPILILTLCYSRICRVVWISAGSKEDNRIKRKNKNKSIMWKITFRKTENQQLEEETEPKLLKTNSINPRGHMRSVSKSKVKTIKMTLAVVLCFFICWTPFYTVTVWSTFDSKIALSDSAMVIILLLANLNSCTNPWIYLCFSGRICGRPKDRRMSRSWTQSTQVTHTNDSESRSQHSNYDIYRHPSRESNHWTRTSMTSSC